MEINYSHTFKNIPNNIVWNTIQNPEVLKNVLPGCKVFEEVGSDKYESVLGINMGPIKGEFTAEVEQIDKQEPTSYRLLVKAKGKPGELDANALMEFTEVDGNTEITCTADVTPTGLLASIGQRIMGGVAKVIISQFFKDIEKEAKKAMESN